MIGAHVAASIGNALPGLGGAGGGIIGQQFFNNPQQTSAIVPAGALWVFAEIVGSGGAASGSGFGASGGAGNDVIAAVSPGDSITFVVPGSTFGSSSTPVNASVTIGGGTITATSSPRISGTNGTAISGKYAGLAPSGGKGGMSSSRLGGRGMATASFDEYGAGIGGGGLGAGSATNAGGIGAVCLTYFASQEAAVAFANSLYGGAWTP